MEKNFLKNIFSENKLVGVYFGNSLFSILGIDKVKKTKIGLSFSNLFFSQKMLTADSAGSVDSEHIGEKLYIHLNATLRDKSINKANCVFVLQERDVFVRTMRFPNMPNKELESALRFELKHLLPVKLSDVQFSYSVFPVNNGKSIDVMAIAIPLSTIDKYGFKAKNISLVFVSASIALVSLLNEVYASDFEDSSINLAIYMDNNRALIVFFSKQVVLLSRDVIVVNKFASIKDEIRISVDYLAKNFRSEVVVKSVFVLGDLMVDDVPEDLCSWQDCSVSVLKADDLIARQISLPQIEDVSGAFFALAGITAHLNRATMLDMAVLNKQKKKTTKRPKQKERNPSLELILYWLAKIDAAYLFIFAAVLLGIGAMILGINYSAWEKTQRKYESMVASLPKDVFLNPEEISNNEIMKKKQEFERQNRFISKYIDMRKNRYMYKIFRFLGEDLPGNMWLSFPIQIKFDMEKGKFMMKFTANVFLGDMDEELKAVDKLITEMRKKMPGYFDKIEVTFFKRKETEDYEYLNFGVRCY